MSNNASDEIDEDEDARRFKSMRSASSGRRRRLSIVAVPEFDGEDLDAAIKGDDYADGESEFLLVGQMTCAGHEDDGHKKTNQDSLMVVPDFAGDPMKLLVGVFDGHGAIGHIASQFCKKEVAKHLLENEDALSTANAPPPLSVIGPCLERSFVTVDANLKKLDRGIALSGTTATCAYIHQNRIYLANAGDSRAVLAREEDGDLVAVDLTFDHKPDVPSEKERVLASGGKVHPLMDEDEPIGPERVWMKEGVVIRGVRHDIPGIAMTRSLGDTIAGNIGVVADPECFEYNIQKADTFMILATDGVWEFISSQEAVDICKGFENPQHMCDALMEESKVCWEREEDVRDDITVVVVKFNLNIAS